MFNWISWWYAASTVARKARVGRPQALINCCICESKWQILVFANKIMHNFKIRFRFVKHFFKSNLYLSCIYWWNVKNYFILKNKSIFTFKDTGLGTQKFDQKINYYCITRLKFWLSLYSQCWYSLALPLNPKYSSHPLFSELSEPFYKNHQSLYLLN